MQIKILPVALLITTSSLFTGCGSQPTTAPSPKSVGPAPMAVTTMPTPAMPTTQALVLKFSPKSIKAIQAGTKTATIRKGVRAFPPGLVRAVGTDGNVVMLDGVTVNVKKFSELTDVDAKANGSASLDELKTELARDYKGIAADDTVTVIGFRLGSGM
jgi:uncharacterized protein YqfB (UPF0267 family)